MTDSKLVSVIMPCFNAAQTLPWALGSLLAQTYRNWECIIVDDGSTDASARIIKAVSDQRIKFIQFDRNRGRAAARQAALDAAQGEYLAMLDADDWLYPNKLELQVDALERHDIVLVGAGMIILDRRGDPIGVRGTGPNEGITLFPGSVRLRRISIVHGPAMLRIGDSRVASYDESLAYAEDKDFLLRVMYGKPYALLGEPLYVYNEHQSVTRDKIIQSLDCNRQIFRKYLRSHPVASLMRMIETFGKQVVYRALFFAGRHEAVLRRRSAEPSVEQLCKYHWALNVVSRKVSEVRPMDLGRPRSGEPVSP